VRFIGYVVAMDLKTPIITRAHFVYKFGADLSGSRPAVLFKPAIMSF
jgi:hypothetical protein